MDKKQIRKEAEKLVYKNVSERRKKHMTEVFYKRIEAEEIKKQQFENEKNNFHEQFTRKS